MLTTGLSAQSARTQVAIRVLAILCFTLLTAVAAKMSVTLPFTPVPITLQVMVVLLAGLVLGPIDGFLSQAAYLVAIASGLPLDARSLGPAAFFGPTAGYLLGFAPAAVVTGWLGGVGSNSFAALLRRLAGALAGVAVVYSFGTLWLGFVLGDFGQAVALGVGPFILIDLAKALVAASACSAAAALREGTTGP